MRVKKHSMQSCQELGCPLPVDVTYKFSGQVLETLLRDIQYVYLERLKEKDRIVRLYQFKEFINTEVFDLCCGLHFYNEKRARRICMEILTDRIKVYGYEEIFKEIENARKGHEKTKVHKRV